VQASLIAPPSCQTHPAALQFLAGSWQNQRLMYDFLGRWREPGFIPIWMVYGFARFICGNATTSNWVLLPQTEFSPGNRALRAKPATNCSKSEECGAQCDWL